MADQEFLESIADSSQPAIVSGLEVIASTPPSMSVTIISGFGYIEGRRVEIGENTTLTIPTGKAVWYVLVNAGVRISKYPLNAGLIAAKIILQEESLRIVQEKVLVEGPDGYLIDGRSVYSATKYDPSDPAFRYAVAQALPDIFAENIFGELTLSEKLRLVNARGTMEARSDGMRFFDTSGRILAEYLSTRARVGGWEITPGLLQSSTSTIKLDSARSQIQVGASQGILIDGPGEAVGTSNFISGPLGQGWRITPEEAEFQNARIRGIFSTSVFKKDTISASNAINIWSNSTVLKADLGSGDTTTITVEDPVFTSGDRVRLKDGFDDEWMLVSSSASANGGYWNYTVTRDYAGSYSSGNPAWKIGTAIVSLGNWNGSTGTGFLMADAASSYSPYLDIFIRTGPNPTQYKTRARLGRLDGVTDDIFGNLTGYGLYAENAYLRGKIEIGVGSTGYYNLTDIPAGIYQILYQSASPTSGMNVGDYWIDSDDKQLYRYNGTTWDSVQDTGIIQAITDAADAQATADGKIITFVQATAPTAAAVGDIWFNTSDYNKLYRWSGVAWIIANAADVTQTVINGGLITTGYITLADGGNIKSGQTAYNTGTGFWFGKDGTIPKFSLGDPAGEGITWDGANLTISGSVTVTGGDIPWSIVSGTGKPADYATKNNVFYQSSTPTAETTGDLWYNTSSYTFYKWSGTQWDILSDITSYKTAAAIAGQGTLATLNSADYGSNVSGTKPPSDATRNIIYRQASQPSGVTGDLWYDTDDPYQRFYYYTGSSWSEVGNYTTNTTQLTDGANLGGTATWSGVSGTGKPADYATKNNVFYQSSTPTAETTGDLWYNTSSYTFYKWSGTQWDILSDITSYKTAAAIAGQGTLATLNSADYGSNVSGTKPPSDATRNIIYRQASQPSGVTGDLWYDTDDPYQRFYYYTGSSWSEVGNYTTNTTQLTDGANLGGTATWAGVSGKPTFGNMAYENLVELAKLGNTVISGGYLQTILINADVIQAGTITGRTIRTAASGERIDLSAGTKEARWYDSANNLIASVGKTDGNDNAMVYGKNGISGGYNQRVYGGYFYNPDDSYFTATNVRNAFGVGGVAVYGVGGYLSGGRGNITLPINTTYSSSNIINNTLAPPGTLLRTSDTYLYDFSDGSAWLPFGYAKIVTWTGNGTSQAISCGFQPDKVEGTRSSTTSGRYWWAWISGMATDRVRLYNDGSMPTGVINSIDSTGFTVGSNVNSNESGVAYSAVCSKMKVN